ncbi:ICE family protease (caspase) p20 domain-containing protein [Besnoitia besnoiti]|uniref:ICE family protease (Caspase) p20 domain-containing protein n=1 Tax=Besnoitia besnoiti TaxID=94643 RepID=A0A2A9MJ51_BESBE|nr:ICE family protease (caspase) p20 domain-containing protein [Besnoitia besnoiti]PFH35996.1 ICE family protease (caspase) p20 domain-containing protein [Besnoitia besnoiti]
MAHLKPRVTMSVLRVDGLDGAAVSSSHGYYVKFRWRGEKYKTEPQKKLGASLHFSFNVLLPFQADADSPVLSMQLWAAGTFSHKKVAEATVDLTKAPADSRTVFAFPLAAVNCKNLGASPVLVLAMQMQYFDEAANKAELQQRLDLHAEEQRQRRAFEHQQTVLEHRLLAGCPPPVASPPRVSDAPATNGYPRPAFAQPQAPPACPAAPNPPAPAYPASPGPYPNYPYAPPPPGGACGPYGLVAVGAAPQSTAAYGFAPGGYSGAPAPGCYNRNQGTYGGSSYPSQYAWAAPQQLGCVSVPPERPPPKEQQASLTASGHWKDGDIQYVKTILPQCSKKEIEGALTEAGGDREKAVDILLKRLVAQAAEANETHVHDLEHQAEEVAQQPAVSWTQYSAAPAAPSSYGPPGPMVPVGHAPPLLQVAPQHYGFTPAPMYAQVGKILPSGRRKALLIGINYRGTRAELRGCVNDVHRMKNLLCSIYGFHDSSTTMVVLTDDNPNALYRPTRNNMLKAMRWLSIDNRPGDSLFFHYSGHGGRQVDRSGIEQDGYDETILPVDFDTAGQILDDELHAFLVQPLQNGCRLTAVMDCCHSGTGLDLPFTWNTPKWRWDEETNPFYVLGDVQMFSGCADDETSADLAGHEARAPGGAMTTAFIAVLTARPFGHSYPSLMQGLTESMVSRGLSQRPQLTSSQKFDFNRPFNLSDVIPNHNKVLGRQIRRRRKPLPEGAGMRGRPGAGMGDVVLLAGAGLATGLLVGSLLSD